MKILLAEPSLRSQIAMADGLRTLGHCVHVVCDGVEAIRRLRGGRFDAAFLDQSLPMLELKTTINFIRSYLPKGLQPRIILTFDGRPMDVHLPDGADSVVVKTASPKELEDALRAPEGLGRLSSRDEVLDKGRLSELIQGESSPQDFFKDLTQTFATQGMQMLTQIYESWESGDAVIPETLRELRGSSTSLGALKLGRVCQALESAGSLEKDSVFHLIQEFSQFVHSIWEFADSLDSMGSQPVDSVIYIVDDEKHNVQLLEKLLRSRGYRRVLSTTSASLFEILVKSRLPDLVLLDHNMAPKSGIEVLRSQQWLMEVTPPVPVVMLTAERGYEVRRTAFDLGARDFLNKPFDPPEIIARIRNLLEGRFAQMQLLSQQKMLEGQVLQRTAQLAASQSDALGRLAMAAELRVDPTGEHVSRVSRLAWLLSRGIGLDEETSELFMHAAKLHDVGMISVPDSIVLKAGIYTSEESAVMRTHTGQGSKLLAQGDYELLRLAEEVARSHHERWDGQGYPAGLTANEIPLIGRIVAICDAFDAMNSPRSYRPQRDFDEALKEIEKHTGTQFDPLLVQTFLSLRTELRIVCEARSRLPDVSNS